MSTMSAVPSGTFAANEPGVDGATEPKSAAPDVCALSLTLARRMATVPLASAVTSYWRQSARQGPPAAL